MKFLEEALNSAKTYSVMVRGENCIVRVNHQVQNYGFFATRVVKAHNSQQAFKVASHLIKAELDPLLLNTVENAPLMYPEEVAEWKRPDEHQTPKSGFVWFPNDSNQ